MNWIYKAYDSLRKTLRVDVLNPDYDHYTSVEHPVDSTNIDAGNNYQIILCTGYRELYVQVLGDGGVTFTAYRSLSKDASDTDETDGWVDMTASFFLSGAAVVDTGDDGILVDRMPYKVMIKYVTSDAVNGSDIWIRHS